MRGIFDKIGAFFKSLTRFVFFLTPKMSAAFHKQLAKHPAAERIYNLTSLQITNSRRYKATTTLWKKILLVILQLALIVGLVFLFKFAIGLFESSVLITRRFDQYYLATVLSIYSIFTVIEMSVSLVNTLYKAKDNAMLFVYPVKPEEIFISKLLVKYIRELKKAIFFIVPFLIAFYLQEKTLTDGVNTILNIGFIFKIIPVFLFLPPILVLLSGLISIIFSLVDTLFKKYPVAKIVTSILVTIAVFALIIVLINLLKVQMNQGGSGDGEGRTANLVYNMWYYIIQDISNFFAFITPYLPLGFSVTNFLINHVLWKFFVYFFAFILLIALLGVLNAFVSLKFFFKLSSGATERGSSKKRVTKDKLNKNIFLTFFLKEVKTYMRSDDGAILTFVLAIVLPLTTYCLNKFFMLMNISDFGTMIIVCVNLLLSLTIITSTNVSSANALSREGSEFYLLKVSPLNTSKICYAKILLNGILCVISISGMAIALKIVNANSASAYVLSDIDILCIFLITLFIGIGHLFYCFEIDLSNPKIRQYAMGDQDTSNVTKALIVGIVLSVLAAVFAIFFFNIAIYGQGQTDRIYRWPSLLIIAIIYLGTRIWLFNKKLNVYFDELS